ncbi:hypothetical protein [Diaphorobacter caeni]|uniref:hypothetical protein n=1 Tax=Diaphorobacter caeni TaxID=2784387 RepID=UPI00188FDC24|nr:hypothetical protein [Diaphorobacter caeni]MBF5007648.1 hypothetical protein [Diaphorobacter caeni]
MASEAVYHATVFEPTVDELTMLKRLEMGELVSLTDAIKKHLSGRLLEWGMVGKTFEGNFMITDLGRQQVKRSTP